jgi:hypothetical protein
VKKSIRDKRPVYLHLHVWICRIGDDLIKTRCHWKIRWVRDSSLVGAREHGTPKRVLAQQLISHARICVIPLMPLVIVDELRICILKLWIGLMSEESSVSKVERTCRWIHYVD